MMRTCLTILALVFCTAANAQRYDASAIFAHNDYARATPFYEAYDLGVGYIEADVFLVDTKLMVAHHRHEIRPERDLEKLYFIPLLKKVRQHEGYVYEDHDLTLTLMIDLKTEGAPTLRALVNLLEEYPELVSNRTLHFMISGSVPDPGTWDAYPSYITFDGRPGIVYTPRQLDRVRMISTSFTQHVKWDGRGKIPREAKKVIRGLMSQAHAKNKPFRFWGTPDFENAWRTFIRLKMDVIVTDDVAALARFLGVRE